MIQTFHMFAGSAVLLAAAAQPQLVCPLAAQIWRWRRRSAAWLLVHPSTRMMRARTPGLFLDIGFVALLGGFVSAFALLPPQALPLALSLCLTLVMLAIYDLRWLRLPDRLTFPLAAAALVDAAFREQFLSALVTGLVTFACLLALREAAWRWKGKDGLGLGDVKMAAAMGVLLGPDWIAPALFIAALLGVAGQLLARLHTPPENEIQPFGPSLAIACWVAFLCQRSGLPPLCDILPM
jgi:leader peptidase (prepilin peptidase) / N-methyltransferase